MRNLKYVFAALIASSMLGGTSQAEITQTIGFFFDPTPSSPVSGDEVADSDQIRGNTDSEINRSILAGITGTGFSASGSVGEFGNYGVQGQSTTVGEFRAQVIIEADVQAPAFGVAREAFANFIIDGGTVAFVAGENSNLRLLLTLDSDSSPLNEFQSGFELFGSVGGNPTYAPLGTDDMGATFNGTSVDIPFSFQSVSLGVLNPGQVINFRYQLDITANIENFSEITFFEFEDPLSISPPPVDVSLLRPTISFVSAVPEPSMPMILLAAFATSQSIRRRRRSRGK